MTRLVIITGAEGQLGTDLCSCLKGSFEVIPTDVTTNLPGTIKLDITDGEQINHLLDEYSPAAIINAGAYTNVDGNETNPDMAELVNSGGVVLLVAAAKKINAKVVQISTDYVFDGSRGPYLEDDDVNPISVYGRTKLSAEEAVLSVESNLVIRANVLFGSDLGAKASFVRWVVESLSAGEKIRVVDDQFNNPTWTSHLAEAIRVALDKNATGLMHYGGLDFVSRYQFACEIAGYFKLPHGNISPIKTMELGQAAPRPLRGGLICSKMKTELGINNYTIRESLEEAFPSS